VAAGIAGAADAPTAAAIAVAAAVSNVGDPAADIINTAGTTAIPATGTRAALSSFPKC
jgi:hypothetical protein